MKKNLFVIFILSLLIVLLSFTLVFATTIEFTPAEDFYTFDTAVLNTALTTCINNFADYDVVIATGTPGLYYVEVKAFNIAESGHFLHLKQNGSQVYISNSSGTGFNGTKYRIQYNGNIIGPNVSQGDVIDFNYESILYCKGIIYDTDYVDSDSPGTSIYSFYTPAVNKTISLPPGYAISFKQIPDAIIQDNSFILKETSPLGIPAFISTWDKGTYYKYTDGFLTPEYSKSMYSFDTINYDIDRSLFKVNYISSKFTFNSSKDTINFFNPVMYSISPTNKASNGTKTIVYPANAYTVKLYNIVTSDKYGFILEGYEDSDYQYNDDDPEDYQSNPYFTDKDGNPITPPDGGSLNNEEPGKYTQESALDKIKEIINNFKNTLINLFSAPTGAISSLIDAGGSFMGVVAGMFTWLPSPVAVVIQSGLILLVVIGVLKMLL